MKKIFIHNHVLLLVCILTFVFANTAYSQTTKKDRKKEEAIALKTAVFDSQHYVFYAQTAIPQQGVARNLSYGYQVEFSKNQIDSYLPFFGVAYSIDYGSTTSPLEFISKQFSYSQTDGKKGGWSIVIQTNDTKDLKKLFLTVFENGSASLSVIGNDRQSISFSGYVEPFKENKK